MAEAHLEDVAALVGGGVIGFPLMTGAAEISYFGHNLGGIEYTAAEATLGLGLILTVLAGLVAVTTNDVRGDVDQIQKGAAATVIGLPIGYSFVPAIEEVVHYAGQTSEAFFIAVVIAAFLALATLPNERVGDLLQ